MKYELSIPELMNFFAKDGHHGFSVEEIGRAEQRLGVSLPPVYRDFLASYGQDPINTHLHQIFSPEEIVTTYQLIEDTLKDWTPEFEIAVRDGRVEDYADNGYFKLWRLPREQWPTVTENYLLIWCENQGVWNAGYRMEDLLTGEKDPPVYISTEDDFITFRLCARSTEDFLWEMLRQAADGFFPSSRKTVREEIKATLEAAQVEPRRLMVERSLNGWNYFSGSCLDEEKNILYLYYGDDKGQELLYSCKELPDGEENTPHRNVVLTSPSPPKPAFNPLHLALTSVQRKDLGMDRPKPEGGIPLNPLIALTLQQATGQKPSTAYDWTRLLEKTKVLKLHVGYSARMGYKEPSTIYIPSPGEAFPPEPYYFDLEDWSAIGRMKNLRTLVMDHLYVEDFSFLTQCENLRSLSLYGTTFRDCRLLLELPNLKSADLYLCQLEHTEALEKLKIECRR